MLKTFKYRLFPSRTQARLLDQTLETCRRWWNTCLAERKTAYAERKESTPALALPLVAGASVGKYAVLATRIIRR